MTAPYPISAAMAQLQTWSSSSSSQKGSMDAFQQLLLLGIDTEFQANLHIAYGILLFMCDIRQSFKIKFIYLCVCVHARACERA